MFIDVDKSVAPYLPYYKINLIHPNLPDSELLKLRSELGMVMQFIKNSNDKKKLMDNLENNKKFHNVSNISATLIKETTGLNLKINKEKERIDMCQAVKDLIKDATKEANKQIKEANKQIKIEQEKNKAEKEKTKAEKEKTKAALLRIKELEKIIKNLQTQLKTA